MDNKNNVIFGKHKYVRILLIITAAILIYAFIDKETYNKVLSVMQPIIIGAVLAYLLNPLVNWFESMFNKLFRKISKKPEKLKHLNKGFSITLTLVAFVLLVSAVLWLIIPQISTNITEFVKKAPTKAQAFVEWYNGIAEKHDLPTKIVTLSEWLGNNGGFTFESITSYFKDHLLAFSGLLGNEIISFFGSTFTLAFNIIIGLIVCIYLLISKCTLAAQFKKVLYAFASKEKADDFLDTAREGNRIVTRFIIGKLIDSTIIGVMCFVVLIIFDIPYALLVSVIVGVTDIIPFFGPYLGAIPCTLLILLSDEPIKALYFVIIIVVVQQVEGNIISPKIIGDTIGLSPFWVITAMIIGGGLFGLAGMLMGVPVVAIAFFILKKSTEKRLKTKEMPLATSAYMNDNIIE